jgi:hypothetical protein
MNTLRPLIIGSLFLLVGAAAARAADTLDAARERYAAAEYEEALAMLERVKAGGGIGSDSRAVDQYRAYCLLALNRQSDAEGAIAAVVISDPLYQPNDSEVSPRVRTAFREVRRRMLPSVVQERYAFAKAAFEAKEFDTASTAFASLLKVMADPDLAPHMSTSPLSDLKMLATGFADLAARSATPAPIAAVTKSSNMALPIGRTTPKVYSNEDPGIVPPLALQQTLPAFSDVGTSVRPGVLELLIDERGAVESAVLRVNIHPRIDGPLLEAVRRWKYQPAILDGGAVKYRKLVQVDVKK